MMTRKEAYKKLCKLPVGHTMDYIALTSAKNLINEIFDRQDKLEAELKPKDEEIGVAKKVAQDAYTLGAGQAAEMDRFWEAFGQEYYMSSGISFNINLWWANVTPKTGGTAKLEPFDADNEPEAIFQAGEWILHTMKEHNL